MALQKVTYVDGTTIITAQNLNDIQDEIIAQGNQQAADEAEIALKANAADVYSKTDADNLLDLKADKSDTYTKAQVDSALNLKADKSDTYTKAQVNSALSTKADTSAMNSALALKADKSDTYTKTEVDSALALKADASSVYTKTEIDTELEDYAKVDGSYEQMTVGNAEQLVTNLTDTESEPFTFRTSGGALEIGDREELTVVGGSVVWNQLVNPSNIASTTTQSGITFTNNGDGTVTVSGVSTSSTTIMFRIFGSKTHPIGKYLLCGCPKQTTAKVSLAMRGQGPDATDYGNGTIWNSENNQYKGMVIYVAANADLSTPVTFKPQFFNLTQMFGSTIADYIYNLEQTTAGAGVAFFKKYFPKDYYAYNTGEMLHVQTSEFKTVGFNQWDEQWEVGYISSNGGLQSGSGIRSKNYCNCVPSTSYRGTCPSSLTGFMLCWYDADKNFISRSDAKNKTATSPNNAYYFKVSTSSGDPTTYGNNICINLYWDGTRDGEYEEYKEWVYPLDSDLELRGIPKLDTDGNLVYDGDIYESDGTVTRKYGIINLGEIDWTLSDSNETNIRFGSTASYPIAKSSTNNINNFDGGHWSQGTQNTWSGTNVNTLDVRSGNLIISISKTLFTGSTATEFETWCTGKYIVYELATPTTETAEPYQSPQIVDNWGTEEFVVPTQSGVEIPVGHETVYPISLRDKLESAPNLPDDDGDYLLHMANGEASYKQLVSEFPSAPTTDGTYVLKATVSNGTATLTWVTE